MSPDTIRAEIERPTGKDWEQEMLERFRPVDSTELFRGLFPLAADSQTNSPAFPAAWLLYKLKPDCLISCREAIAALLPEWDISIEEVVFYLAEQFGVPQMMATIEEMRRTITNHSQRTSLDAVRYWLGRFQEMQDYRARNDAV